MDRKFASERVAMWREDQDSSDRRTALDDGKGAATKDGGPWRKRRMWNRRRAPAATGSEYRNDNRQKTPAMQMKQAGLPPAKGFCGPGMHACAEQKGIFVQHTDAAAAADPS
jgi:hypothetical protein